MTDTQPCRSHVSDMDVPVYYHLNVRLPMDRRVGALPTSPEARVVGFDTDTPKSQGAETPTSVLPVHQPLAAGSFKKMSSQSTLYQALHQPAAPAPRLSIRTHAASGHGRGNSSHRPRALAHGTVAAVGAQCPATQQQGQGLQRPPTPTTTPTSGSGGQRSPPSVKHSAVREIPRTDRTAAHTNILPEDIVAAALEAAPQRPLAPLGDPAAVGEGLRPPQAQHQFQGPSVPTSVSTTSSGPSSAAACGAGARRPSSAASSPGRGAGAPAGANVLSSSWHSASAALAAGREAAGASSARSAGCSPLRLQPASAGSSLRCWRGPEQQVQDGMYGGRDGGFGSGDLAQQAQQATKRMFEAQAEATTAQAQVACLKDALGKEKEKVEWLQLQLSRVTRERDELRRDAATAAAGAAAARPARSAAAAGAAAAAGRAPVPRPAAGGPAAIRVVKGRRLQDQFPSFRVDSDDEGGTPRARAAGAGATVYQAGTTAAAAGGAHHPQDCWLETALEGRGGASSGGSGNASGEEEGFAGQVGADQGSLWPRPSLFSGFGPCLD